MLFRQLAAICIAITLAGCTNLQRLANGYSGNAPEPSIFQFHDRGNSLYYAFNINDDRIPETYVFFYGGSGCPSWKYVMPSYVEGLTVPARIFVLNKRFVSDRGTGIFGCSKDFHLANNPEQWVSDYSEFITAQLQAAPRKPRNVVLVGVSEGGLVAAMVSGRMPEVTHLAIIGDGAYSMRKSLLTLKRNHAVVFDVDSGWEKISRNPRSIEDTWYGAPYRWWSDIMDIDQLPLFLKLNIPILVGMGENDQRVPLESAQYLESEFKAAGKNNLTLKVYPGGDHYLNAGTSSYLSHFFGALGQLLETR